MTGKIKVDITVCCVQEIRFIFKYPNKFKVKGWENKPCKQQKCILKSPTTWYHYINKDKVDFMIKKIERKIEKLHNETRSNSSGNCDS